MCAVENKPFWQSRTLWGLVISGIAMAAAHWGVQISPDDAAVNDIIEIVSKVVEIAGLVYAFYGRVTAKKTVGLTSK